MKVKWEMGQRLLKLLGSALGFLRFGVTAADLWDNGTMPDNKRGILAVIRGIRE